MGAFKSAVAVFMSVCGICGVASASAGAYATIGAPPQQSASTSLPDGRVYEQVSPADKHGYQAAASSRVPGAGYLSVHSSIAAVNGNAVTYEAAGPAADVDASGVSANFVAERTANGWRSRSSAARALGLNEHNDIFYGLPWVDYSPDLSHLAYQSNRHSVAAAPETGTANIYLMGSNPLEEPFWLLQSVASPSLGEEDGGAFGVALLGMTSDASIVYFAYAQPLLPEDESRSGWGVYEVRAGDVREIGVLPDGSVPASGAYPAAAATTVGQRFRVGQVNPASFDNQVSEDGKRVFFFSSGQLYVHELEVDGSERSVLVSASQLPGHVGEAAPDGVSLFENRTRAGDNANEYTTEASAPTYIYASSDGSHVVFQSVDQLTSTAPTGLAMKVYDFDVDSGTLEYLPGVSLGGIVTAAKDGSWFLFINATNGLELWAAGPEGGQVRPIAELPEGAFVGPGRAVADGSAIVFQAEGPIPGVKGSADEQIYRYEIASNVLTCVSCPPAGVAQSGNAYLAVQDQYQLTGAVNESRGVSSDGKRIFFGSPDPLVSRDINGDYDTYEWEDGKIFLISSGTGSDYSPFLDNSESGGDVFFATADELVEGDNDGGFDVYDARIPRPGDNPPPSAVPCSGDVCQGPPSVPQLLAAPASAAFSGAGNLLEEDTAKPKVKSRATSSRARKLAVALSACSKKKPRSKRKSCERRARKRHAAAGARVGHNGGRGK